MLVEFRVENHRSLREEQALSLAASHDSGERGGIPVPGSPGERLLPVVALYGANASGKSNVLSALAFARHAVLSSHRQWDPEGGVPRTPFAWGDARKEPSTFEFVFFREGTRFEYGFSADDERFVEEWLHAYPHGRRQVWFSREGQTFAFGENLRGENRLVEQVTRENALFLSTAKQHAHEQLSQVYAWFLDLQFLNVRHVRRSRSVLSGPMPVEYWLEARRGEENSERERRLAHLRKLLGDADIGIRDIRVERKESLDEDTQETFVSRRVLLEHKTKESSAWMPLAEESDGTKTLLRLAPTILDALAYGFVVAVDELEASLHPLLAVKLIELFGDPKTNPRHAQLIFTTHDTNLLGNVAAEPLLRRDQVWFTEKGADGASKLYPLTDFKPRKSENLERGYLQGRYGAIPFLGSLVASRGEE